MYKYERVANREPSVVLAQLEPLSFCAHVLKVRRNTLQRVNRHNAHPMVSTGGTPSISFAIISILSRFTHCGYGLGLRLYDDSIGVRFDLGRARADLVR